MSEAAPPPPNDPEPVKPKQPRKTKPSLSNREPKANEAKANPPVVVVAAAAVAASVTSLDVDPRTNGEPVEADLADQRPGPSLPVFSFRIGFDKETGRLSPESSGEMDVCSSQENRQTRVVSYNSGILTIKNTLPRGRSPPRTSPGISTLKTRSSPPPGVPPPAPSNAPPGPIRRNAFALLGKKKESTKPSGKSQRDEANPAESTDADSESLKTSSGKTGRKLDTAQSASTVEPGTLPPDKADCGFKFASVVGATRSRAAPGTIDAPWPVKGTSHVRGLSPSGAAVGIAASGHGFGERKLKNSVAIPFGEAMLNTLARRLRISSLRRHVSSEDYELQKYTAIPPEVRLPTRILATGSQLQEMIQPRLATRIPHRHAVSQLVDSDSDSAASETVAGKAVHPALLRLYRRLRTELTAFDLHKCEAVPWEVKYAPETTDEALQIGREKEILRKWLIGLRTDKVHSEVAGAKRKPKRSAKLPAAAKKKRRKKSEEMDGFVVTSEDECNTMDEITEGEEDDWLNPACGTQKKSTVRSGDRYNEGRDQRRKTNTIVISGPTGSGKTATVFAAARELGYTVFEVNAGARRSGKDILDLVGAMCGNHLVRHPAKGVDDPFSRTNPAAKQGGGGGADDRGDEQQQMRQGQSLVLFEEVDILFEEDKNFWSTVLGLMAKSKRPIVLTCSDESLLPWEDLCLHAILRLSLPPRDLLVDHLLLICANEGHLLRRDSVVALAKAHNNDIRACIMHLQFHCRMAVGDRKGGFDWLLVRWPVGCDIAENGERLRVVSEDTYHVGMGLVPNSAGVQGEYGWRDMWHGYGPEVCDLEEGLDERAVEWKVSLRTAHEFLGTQSDVDVISSLGESGDYGVRSFLRFPFSFLTMYRHSQGWIAHIPSAVKGTRRTTCLVTTLCKQTPTRCQVRQTQSSTSTCAVYLANASTRRSKGLGQPSHLRRHHHHHHHLWRKVQ